MRKLLAIVLAAILGFLGTMALGHVPRNVMVYQDRQIERGANMTSFELNDSDVLEVDGIQFRTLLPEEVVYLPKHGEETSTQFGVQITNQTSIPYRFDVQQFFPEILDPQGKPLYMNFARNVTKPTEESDIPILMPGEKLYFLMDAKLNWYQNCVRILGMAVYGGVWHTRPLKSGDYKIRFSYNNPAANRMMFTLIKGRIEFDGFWVGNIKTPLTPLRLRQLLLH
jgi:hypothetical protein